jgi:hypothetical protein
MDALIEAIERYAEAYAVLEKLQRQMVEHIPRGDQKTGVIAEFFARIYAGRRFSNSRLEFGSTSERAWDFKVHLSASIVTKVQVKAVSEHSETSRISPIHSGWDELWLMRLDGKLLPAGLWTIRAADVPWSTTTLKHRTMPKRGVPFSGSSDFSSAKDEFVPFAKALAAANPRFRQVLAARLSQRSEDN